MKILLLLTLLCCLTPCCKNSEHRTSINSKEAILDIQEKLIRAFWRASDKTLRENTELIGHQSKEEQFNAEHVCKIQTTEQIMNSEDYLVIYRITIPDIKHAYYEFSFRGKGNSWGAIDGRTKIGKQEYNYFKGKFLGKKSLKPYLEAELLKLGAPIKAE